MDRPLDLPELREHHAEALHLALEYLCERVQPTALVVTGSIIRGNPDVNSDLDIFILHAEPWRQRLQRSFAGVPVEFFVNHPGFMQRYFDDERASGRPTTAHMLVTGHLALDTAGLMAGFIEDARRMLAAGPQVDEAGLTSRRYETAMLFEDAGDVRLRDPDLATHFLHSAVGSALRFCFWRERRWQPRNKELLSALTALAPEVAALARRFYQSQTLDERFVSAREIVLATTGELGAFDWQTPRDPLPVDG